jgi:thiamine-monophosphate kinase
MAAPDTIATLGEAALVERIRQRAGGPPQWVHVGIGDDAAVYAPDRNALQVITTDSLVERVHFRADWTAYESVGYKAVAVNLSDLAAMGAEPRGLLLSLALPGAFAAGDFDALIDGVLHAAAESRATLIGGNLSRSPGPVVIDVTATGSVHPRKVLTRAGGRPGDELYVTGALGAAAAGLRLLERAASPAAELENAARECVGRYERPTPRTRCGLIVGRSRGAAAAVDLSDGLAAGVRLLAQASGTGAVVDASRVPVHAGAAKLADALGEDALRLAIAGGEDYELLFAVRPRRRRAFLAAMKRAGGLPVTMIGQLTREPGVWLAGGNDRSPLSEGFNHFA